jgi:hypothetical protein
MVAHWTVFHMFDALYVDGVEGTQSLVALECVDFACEAKGNSHEEMLRMYVK